MTSVRHAMAMALATAALNPFCAAVAQQAASATATPSATEAADAARAGDLSAVDKIGRLHDRLRRARDRETAVELLDSADADYLRWKKGFQQRTGIQYSLDVSLMQQWGFENGGSPAFQVYAAPSVDWTVFRDKTWGTGSVQLAYNYVPTYPTRQNAADISANLGVLSTLNDFASKTLNFAQLTYTQATPDNRWLLTAGQYPLYNFDGNAYLANQQQNFNNKLFSQNGSATYLSTGWGGYLQFNATRTLQFAAGAQATNNPAGQTLSTQGASDHCCAWFGYVQWTPEAAGLGSSQYSLSYFDTPAIASQSRTRNWSLNAVQNLGRHWAVFGRANGAIGAVSAIERSWAFGVAMLDPLARAPSDQIALAVGGAKAAAPPVNPPGARDETVVEAYWTWSFARSLLLTPSVQAIFHPALDPSRDRAWGLSLRAAFLF